MNTVIKNITEADFYLQLQALQSEAHLFKDMGFDDLAEQMEQRIEELSVQLCEGNQTCETRYYS